MSTVLRPELPEPTARIALLPVHRGYPVPWFVCWLDENGDPVRTGEGEPDFRVLAPGAAARAHADSLCWICGGRLGRYRAFLAGAMCAVNRTSAEPPSHVDCAEWSVRACPFLTRPHMRRREAGLPEVEEVPGIMLTRNPGVAVVWITNRYTTFRDSDGGMLFRFGDPDRVLWFSEGREATRAEVEESINSGLPALVELAEKQGPIAVRFLERARTAATELLPR
jgi:hypothetical protein